MAIELTDTQLGILRALCRPVAEGNRFATPATNQEIADQVFLSVDAVKSHLRTLYRKFAIEDLPHNQKRARLVELVLEGGYLGEGATDEKRVAAGEAAEAGAAGAEPASAATPAGAEPAATATPAGPEPTGPSAPTEPPVPAQSRTAAAAPTPPPSDPSPGRRPWAIAGGIALVTALVVAVLAVSGAFDGGGSAAETTGVAAFRADVRGYCRLALAGDAGDEPSGRVERARDYLEVIETVRGRLASEPPPPGSDEALERFRHGLSRAADFTSLVAQGPLEPGSREEANAVAELTFAAGQVQAGALGFGLGDECVAIGDLVARSAQNAAAAP